MLLSNWSHYNLDEMGNSLARKLNGFEHLMGPVKPALMIVDDDPQVLRAVEIDLRQKYGDRFRVLKANSGTIALEILTKLKLRNEPPALFLVDQRMPHMTGVEFLEKAMEIYPDTKRVLLTAYADTDAAIRSINKAKVDYYLMKPWDPPEEHLYPVVSDLLEDWLVKRTSTY